MGALFHLSCFCSSSSTSYKGGSDAVPRWGQLTNLLTTPTVSTWDQFIPNRVWTLINLSPPTALKIQFKRPVTDQNELAFFPPTTMAYLFWISCLLLFILDLSVCLCLGPAFYLCTAAFSRQKLSCFWDVCSIQLGDLIKRYISVFQFRVKISCPTHLWVCSKGILSAVYICSPFSNKVLCLIIASKLEIKYKTVHDNGILLIRF